MGMLWRRATVDTSSPLMQSSMAVFIVTTSSCLVTSASGSGLSAAAAAGVDFSGVFPSFDTVVDPDVVKDEALNKEKNIVQSKNRYAVL